MRRFGSDQQALLQNQTLHPIAEIPSVTHCVELSLTTTVGPVSGRCEQLHHWRRPGGNTEGGAAELFVTASARRGCGLAWCLACHRNC